MVVGSSIYDEDFKVLRMPCLVAMDCPPVDFIISRCAPTGLPSVRHRWPSGLNLLGAHADSVGDTSVRASSRAQTTFQVVTSNDDEEKPSLRDLFVCTGAHPLARLAARRASTLERRRRLLPLSLPLL